MGTNRSGRDPRGARERRRHEWAGPPSGLHVRWVAGGADDLPEGDVEPTGDVGTTVGDSADRPGVTANAEPSRADRELRTGEGSCIGIAEQVGSELTDWLAGFRFASLDARSECRDAAVRRSRRGSTELRRGLGPTATS